LVTSSFGASSFGASVGGASSAFFSSLSTLTASAGGFSSFFP